MWDSIMHRVGYRNQKVKRRMKKSLKQLRRKFCKKLPKIIRSKVMRHLLPPLSLNLENIIFRPAETFDHYVKSFRLVHDVYVDTGYIAPSSTALRIIPHHSHQDSRVFLGMYCDDEQEQEKPIYSISLFPDSEEEGLPMDMAFKGELDKLRAEGRVLAEGGCLASDPLFRRNDMNIPMLGNRMILRYAADNLGADDLVITTHPKFQWIYEDLLLFEKIGEVKEYAYVQNNPAIALRLNLKTMRSNYRRVYGMKPNGKNLYHLFFEGESESSFLPPPKKAPEKRELYNILLNYYLYVFKNEG